MEYLVYTTQNGEAAVVIPAPISEIKKVPGLEEITQEEYEALVWERSIPDDAINPKPLSIADIPDDRYFRNAWKQNGNKVEVNMTAARIIQDDKIRVSRDSKWADFDRRYLSAERDSAPLGDLNAERSLLKNIPQSAATGIAAATTPDELKAIWPEELN